MNFLGDLVCIAICLLFMQYERPLVETLLTAVSIAVSVSLLTGDIDDQDV